MRKGAYCAGAGTLGEQLHWLDATAVAELVRRGDLAPAEPTIAAAECIEQLDTELNAASLRWFDRAIARARNGSAPDGLPVGVQLVAAYGREDVLIRVASQLELAAPWSHRRPY
ncbi:unannotated protein [freshwater metagenome]|uniref:Unannotated protein n=1 Tax=freshwater metagenome TaxID=449393 RepID=A0A6J6RL36_9ZZZZ